MPIINTLITAKDNMSGVVNNLSDNVKKARKKVTEDIGGTTESVVDLEDAFKSMRDGGVSSLSDIADISNKIKTTMGAAQGAAAKFAAGFALVAGGATLAGAAIFSMIESSADYVRQLREVATVSGLTVEQLQQLQKEFRNTGMEVDKLGDINKDVLDHLGDAFRDGSGPADDMKALGLNMKEYNQYVGQADGGIKALIHTFYSLKAAGRNQAEIVNLMETMASDSSHLITTLKDYGSEMEALDAISAQHANITTATAEKYKDWDKNLDTLKQNFNDWKVNFLAPTVEEINKLFSLMNGDWSGSNFAQFFSSGNLKDAWKEFYYGGDGIIPDFLKRVDGVTDVLGNNARESLSNQAALLRSDLDKAMTAVGTTGGFQKPDTGAAARAKAAAAAAERLAAQKSAAADWLAQRDLEIRTEQEKVDANYSIQLKKLDAFHKKGLLDEAQYQRGVQILNTTQQQGNNEQIYQRRMEQLNSQHEQMLISEADYQKRLHEIQAANAGNILDTNQSAALERLNYEHEQKLISEKDYQEKLLALTQEYNQRRADLNTKTSNIANTDMYDVQAEKMQKFNDGINSGINLASSFADTIQSTAEQGSAAWTAAIVVQKGLMITQAIMAANLAAVMAAASTPGGPAAQLAAASTVQTWGYAQAAMIAAQGIMEIAGARANGGDVRSGQTYLVGERGPELFTVPSTGGQITSNANLQKAVNGGNSSSGGNTFVQNNTFNNSGIKEDDAEAIKNMTNALIDKKMADANR